MDMLAALRLQLEWGADEALLDDPVDRFAVQEPAGARTDPSRAALAREGPARLAPMRPAAPSPAVPVVAASDLAGLHAELDGLACPLRATASHTVGPAGDPATGLLLIGEAPGPDDDRSGQAYGGVPGQVLDRVLASAGLSRAHMMLAFLVPWRPPGGRPPSESEIALCLPYMHRLLALARPRRIVLMSGLALRALAGDPGGIRRARGRWTAIPVPGTALAPIPALPMLPPELWLSGAGAKAGTWADLMTLRAALDA